MSDTPPHSRCRVPSPTSDDRTRQMLEWDRLLQEKEREDKKRGVSRAARAKLSIRGRKNEGRPEGGTWKSARAMGASDRTLTRIRALELLADSGIEGCTLALMIAHDFTTELMVALVRAELATVFAEHIRAGEGVMDVLRLRISDAGRRALEAAKA